MFRVQAARASVASVVAELTGVLPKLSSCHRAAGLMSSGGLPAAFFEKLSFA